MLNEARLLAATMDEVNPARSRDAQASRERWRLDMPRSGVVYADWFASGSMILLPHAPQLPVAMAMGPRVLTRDALQ